jgi:hypothetical protein
MMKLLSRRLLRDEMITPLGCTRQVSEQCKRIGLAHVAKALRKRQRLMQRFG